MERNILIDLLRGCCLKLLHVDSTLCTLYVRKYIVFTNEHGHVFLLTKINYHCFEDHQAPFQKRSSTSRDSPLLFFLIVLSLMSIYLINYIYLYVFSNFLINEIIHSSAIYLVFLKQFFFCFLKYFILFSLLNFIPLDKYHTCYLFTFQSVDSLSAFNFLFFTTKNKIILFIRYCFTF